MTGESSNSEELLRRLNTAVPHPARVYDVWLGGKTTTRPTGRQRRLASRLFRDELAAFARDFNSRSSEKVTLRDRDEVARFFTGLDLVEPGVVQVSEWRPRSEMEAAAPNAVWSGVARKNA